MRPLSMSKALLKYTPAAALILGVTAVASPAMAASPQANVPSTIAINAPFKVTVSNIPSGTQSVDLVLVGQDTQQQGYFISSAPVSTGQTSVTVTGTIPSTMTFGSTITTVGGPREINVEFINSSYRPIGSGVSNTVNLKGAPIDKSLDDASPYKLTYDPTTSIATVTNVPANSFVELFFRATGQPESEASNSSYGSTSVTKAGTVTFPVYGPLPTQSGYLEAEIYSPVGPTLDTNELPLSSGLPVGQAPEVPWAALIPAIGVGAGMVVLAKKRRNA